MQSMHSSEAALGGHINQFGAKKITVVMGIFDICIVKNGTVIASMQFSNLL